MSGRIGRQDDSGHGAGLFDVAAAMLTGVLVPLLRPFVEDRYKAAYPNDWRKRLGLDRKGTNRRPDDPDGLLAFMVDPNAWREAFEPWFEGDNRKASRARSLAYDIREMRARFALHPPYLDERDTWRLVDSSRRLLQSFDLLDEETERTIDGLHARLDSSAGIGQDVEDLRASYLEYVVSLCGGVDVASLARRSVGQTAPVALAKIYEPARITTADGAPASGRRPQPQPISARVPATDGGTVSEPAIDVRQHPRVIVVGEAGAGKSSLLRHAALCLAQDVEPADMVGAAGRTPVLIRAPQAAQALHRGDVGSLADYVEHRLTDRFGPLIAADMAAGRAIALVDAFDEVGEPQARARLAEEIRRFSAEHPDTPLIATSRPEGTHGLAVGAEFVRVVLQPLDDEAVGRVVHAWYEALEPDADADDRALRADELTSDLLASPAARDLAGRPLLLTVIVLMSHRGADLPRRRLDLLRLATRTMLEDWPRGRGHDLSAIDLELVLGHVATHTVAGAGSAMEYGRMRHLLAMRLAQLRDLDERAADREAASMIDVIRGQTGTLVEHEVRSSGDPLYRFVHRSFAEYLAAVDLLERHGAGEVSLGDFVFDRRLDAVVEYFFDLTEQRMDDPSRVLGELLALELPFERHVHMGLRLGLRLIERGYETTDRLTRRVLRRGIEAVLTTPHHGVYLELMSAIDAVTESRSGHRDHRSILDAIEDGVGSPLRRAHVRWALRGPLWTDADAREAVEAVTNTQPSARDEDDVLWARHEWLMDDVMSAMVRRIEGQDGATNGRDRHIHDPWRHPAGIPDVPSDYPCLLTGRHLMWLSRALATRLAEVGMPSCVLSDLVEREESASEVPDGVMVVDFGDAAVLDLSDLIGLCSGPHDPRIPEFVARLRGWSEEEIDSALAMLGERTYWRRLDLEGIADVARGRASLEELQRDKVLRVVCWPAPETRVARSPDQMPAWLSRVIASEAEELDGLTVEAVRTIPSVLAIDETWVPRVVTHLLMHPVPDVRIKAAREVSGHYLELAYRDDVRAECGSEIRAALDLLCEADDPDERAEGWRAILASCGPSTPVSRMFGEDGVGRQPTSPLDRDLYGLMLRHLVHLSGEPEWYDSGRTFASQIGHMLDWDDRPSSSHDRFLYTEEPDRVPPEVVEAAWSRTGALDDDTRAWAATVWGWCSHPDGATNELRILLGDSDQEVRMAGFYALQDVDLEDPAWIPEALDALLHDPWAMLFDQSSEDPIPSWTFEDEEFRRGFSRVLLRGLDDGATPLDLDFYMESLHRFHPR